MKIKNIVAIVGRPNVGKSCLFNRLVGERRAIVEPTSGVTRDRAYADVSWCNKQFSIIDTGGLVFKSKEHISDMIIKQARTAINDADLILFVADAHSGVHAYDKEILDFIRTFNKKIILVVNKVDNMDRVVTLSEFYELGVEEISFISALHGLNIDELLDMLVKDIALIENDTHSEEPPALKVALIGRPNVGKSSFMNKLLKEERVIVSDQPGTTRDSIDTVLHLDNQKYIMIDTAGIRQKKKQQEAIDIYSRSRTIQAIKRSDVCIILVDALEGIQRDDLHIFSLIKEEEKCCVIAINKCDLVKLDLAECVKTISSQAAFMNFAFCVLVSAKQGKNLNATLKLVQHACHNGKRKIQQRKLAKTLEEIVEHLKNQRSYEALKLRFLTQLKTRPPVFAFVVNRPELIKASFERFLENRLRSHYDFKGTPIKILFRKKKR
ncbi:MAG: ribosome biogenesis GTPase Der [Candidatus Omnitrophica bacterium]|nr:ribosome biogenesis GTPase Der [Candidatus Omnitrophota bacterium]